MARISRRSYVLLSVLVAICVAAVIPKYVELSIFDLSPSPPPSPPHAPATSRPLDPGVEARLARIDSRLRLPPDARALHALGEISALLGGESPTPAEAAFASGSWMITQRGAQVGLLSAYPSFESILSLLEQWAEHERARPGAVSLARNPKPDAELARLLSTFDDAAAFEVLEKVDARWAKGRASVGDLLAASEALAQLALLFPNGSLAKDAVEARALGSLALAKTYAPGATLRIEAQIAHALDYGADARAAGAQLPESDPLRAFLFRDVPALERAVAQKSASPETLFLYGRALVLGSEPDEWIEWYQGLSKRQKWTASVAVAPVDVGSVPTGHGAANLYAAILLTRSGVSIPDAEGFDAPLLLCPQLGAAVAARAKGRPGRFADAAFERAAYEGACIAALRAKLTFYVDWLGDPASALALAKKLPREGAPELADLRSWTELVAGRSRDLSALEKRLAQPSTLAPSERDRLSGRALALLPLRMGSQAMDVADSLARSLDSRPASREIASRLAMDVYRDSGLAEDLYGATSDAFGDDRPDLRAYLASFRGDLKTLWSIAESPDQPARILRDALRDLDVDPDRPRLRAAYEAAIGKHPDDQTLRRDFATFLGKKLDDHEAAREELRAVLGTHPDGLVADVIISEVARLYRLDKRYGDSWALVAPRLEGEVGGILAEGVRALIGLGDLERAEKLARAALTRYPENPTVTGDLACVLWAQHKPRDAAQLIGSLHLGEADEREIHSISHAFERAFANKPVAEVEAAFKELGAVKLSYNQLEDIIDVQRAGHAYETAFALGQLMPFPDGQIQLDVESYASLKLARGPDAALAWLRPRWHGRTLVVAAKVVYFRGRDELLWSLYDADEPEGGEETWMYRALAYLRERKPEAAQQKLLEKHYASPGKTFAERAIATAVRGDDGQALLAKVHDESELALAAYALGIRAEHYRRAMRMFQLAVTTSPAAGNPQNLASEELRGLAGSYSLELLATGFWPVADAQ